MGRRAVAERGAPGQLRRDLTSIACADGSLLRFRAEAERSRSDNLLLVRSDYRAPSAASRERFPAAIALASGLGVVEHHRARW